MYVALMIASSLSQASMIGCIQPTIIDGQDKELAIILPVPVQNFGCCCQTNTAVKQAQASCLSLCVDSALTGDTPHLRSKHTIRIKAAASMTLLPAKHVASVIAVDQHYKVTAPSSLNLCVSMPMHPCNANEQRSSTCCCVPA